MKIETKYNIGDKVIILANDKYSKVCPFCNGKEVLTILGEKYYCQNCDDGIITCKTKTKSETIGEIIGIEYCQRFNDDYLTEDNRDYYTRIEKNMTYKIQYMIITSDKVYSKGTYDENEIIKLAY